MAFLRIRQGSERVPTNGLDDKDFVEAGIRYNLVFLGSILVPTAIGHGSSRTENAVDKVYHEKYKAFGYGSRKVAIEIAVDEIKVFESSGRNEKVVAKFQTTDVTYFNVDLKHDKAFVFVVSDEKDKSYRAYVFHCDNSARAREVLIKFREAFQMKENKAEEMRLRAFSAPSRDLSKQARQRVLIEPNKEKLVPQFEDGWGGFKGSGTLDETTGGTLDETTEGADELLFNGRQRSQTEIYNVNELLLTGIGKQNSSNVQKSTEITQIQSMNANLLRDKEGGQKSDEFTELAEKRLRSFDDQALAGTGEGLLLLNTNTAPQSMISPSQNKSVSQHEMESENLLQF